MKKYERHGMRGTGVYNAWRNMIQRCYNPNNGDYKDYGARGITVCKEWTNFPDYHEYVRKLPNYGKEGHTLDRIENNKGYYPSNVKYSTKSDQAYNRRKRKGTKSKHKGVSWYKALEKWLARITINGKQIHIGYFNTELEASEVYQKALSEII